MTKKEAKVYKKLVAMKAKIPEGTEWTNKMYYKWNGGVYRGGYGCSAFAFKLSDKAFGKKKVKLHKSFAKIRVSNIVRMHYKIFERFGIPGYKALIPFYSSYLMFDTVWGKGQGWLFILTIIPVIGTGVSYVLLYKLSQKFGKDDSFFIAMMIRQSTMQRNILKQRRKKRCISRTVTGNTSVGRQVF